MLGDLEPDAACEIVGHLLSDCPACKQITGSLWEDIENGLGATLLDDSETETPRPSPYEGLFDRALARASHEVVDLAQERASAPSLYLELSGHPQPRRLTLARNSRRFQTWALCELLIEKSYDTRFEAAQTGVELAELAVAAAQKLDPTFYGSRQTQDLLGRCWAYLGNALRVRSDLRQADEAFHQAGECFDQGTGDRLDRALLYRFQAHLLRARRQFEPAHRMQDRAVALYRECGETHLIANTLSDQALGLAYSGEPERAVPLLEEALELVDSQHEPRMVAGIRHNLAHCLNEVGLSEQALHLLRQVHPVYHELGDTLSLVRVRWLEGKILHDLGHEERAEDALTEARDALVDQGVAYDAALVSLDLAATFAAQGRLSDMRRLAEQMLPIFESRDVHREAMAALLVFRQAARAEEATLALVHEISVFLRQARSDPGLRLVHPRSGTLQTPPYRPVR
jgi:tetratricopeptide (TPR) repeat protein